VESNGGIKVFTHQLSHTNFSQLTWVMHDITAAEKEFI
jgi:hypothetical protein